MSRHIFTADERSRGGKARAAQPDYREMCQKGFSATLDKHPFFARKWLKKWIRSGGRGRYPMEAI